MFKLHARNLDDRTPIPELLKGLFGKVFAEAWLCFSKTCLRTI
jgi:hypothetical protein